MAQNDRWRNDPERYGRRDDDRERWRDEDRRQDYGRGGSGDPESGWGRGGDYGFEGGGHRGGGPARSGEYRGGSDEVRRGSRFGGERGGGYGYEGGFGGYGRGEPRRASGRGAYGGSDDDRGFYGADQGYGRSGQDSDLDAAYRELRDRGDGYVGRDRNYGFSGGQDQGFWRAAADEVRSWFGDEDAERRRQRSDEQHHRGRGPRNYARSDERIRDDVNDRLTDDPYVDASEIEVSVQNREVTLSGTVNSRSDKRRAEDVAESVSGVTHVQNNLRVQSQTSSLGMGGERTGAGFAGTGAVGTATAAGRQDTSPVEVSRPGDTSRRTGTKT